MAEPSTIARPYAEAVFKLADESERARPVVGDARAALAAVAADERDARGDGRPEPDRGAGGGPVHLASSAGRLSGDAENCVRVLAENGRLELLPADPRRSSRRSRTSAKACSRPRSLGVRARSTAQVRRPGRSAREARPAAR